MSDAIFITGLTIHAHHGVMRHETEVGQQFVIDLELAIDLAEAGASDKLVDTVSYASIVEAATRAFTARSFRLVEAAARAIADEVLASFARVASVRVTVHKPHAPIAAIFNDVGVTILRMTAHDRENPFSAAEALIALGGNVGDARATLDQAVAAFCDGNAVRLLARSSDYRTPPWGVEDQPPFVNACIAVGTSLGPTDLLARALDVERAFGRDRARERRWGPRPLDIDLLAYDDVTLDGPDLILPHPRLFERAFVLVPLAEIAPERQIAGVRIADALARLDTAGIERLPPRNRPA